MKNWNFILTYELNGKTYTLNANHIEQINMHQPLSLSAIIDEKTILIQANSEFNYKISAISFTFNIPISDTTTAYLNGYQSWTDSKEHFKNEREFGIHKLAESSVKKRMLDMYGSTPIYTTPRTKGRFHGFTYMYIRNNDILNLWGSLSEYDGYTIFDVDMNKESITIKRDCLDVVQNKSYNILNLIQARGPYNSVFDTYFNAMDIPKPKVPKMCGWTSWYNYYQNISDDIITHNINQFIEKNIPIDIFQIDDGYQCYVGDWLDIDTKKFPKGVAHFPEMLHNHDIKAGIWLAPFVAERNSRLFNEHRDWFLQSNNGDYICAGFNWSTFYVLDIYNLDVQAYLEEVFHTIIQKWNYDLVKLDFLYAVCLGQWPDKTRGQVMCEALDLLRKWVGPGLILGCGVPLGPAFGKVDFCRIGCDVGLDWNDKWWMHYMHRERISTKNAITNTIGRYHLTNRAFMNDPDVFLLRDDNIQLSVEERKLLAEVNGLLGDLLFTSDDLLNYQPWQNRLLKKTFSAQSNKIQDIQLIQPDVYKLTLVEQNESIKTYYINLNTRDTCINNTVIKSKSISKTI